MTLPQEASSGKNLHCPLSEHTPTQDLRPRIDQVIFMHTYWISSSVGGYPSRLESIKWWRNV